MFENKNGTSDWHSDLTANTKCDDLEGLIINASVALTDYVSDGQQEYFDLAEFFGTQYRIQRVTIDSDKKVLALKELKTDSIGSLFGCTEPTMTTTTPTTPSTLTASPTKLNFSTSNAGFAIESTTTTPKDHYDIQPATTTSTTTTECPKPTEDSTKEILLWILLAIFILILLIALVALILYWQSIKRGDFEVTNIPLTEMEPRSHRQRPPSPGGTPSIAPEPVAAPSDDLRVPSVRSLELSEPQPAELVNAEDEQTRL